MSDALARAALQRIQNISAAVSEPDSRWLDLCREINPAQVIADLTMEQRNGAAAEAHAELDRVRRSESPNACRIPWETLALRSQRHLATRADTVASLSQGGYLVQTLNFSNAAQALMSMLVLGRLGATPLDARAAANMNLPRVNTASTAYWLTDESTQVTESDQVFGQLALSPRTVGGYTEISRLLVLQSSPSAGDVVANDLRRKIARAIEAAAFSGSGVAGQPLGLANVSTVNAVSGASYALSTGMTSMTDTNDALTDDASPGWAANRSVASLLRQRQEFSGSPLTLWRGPLTWGTLHDVPAGSTSGIASGTMFFGNWAYLVVCDFAGGLEISLNPFTPIANWQKAIIGCRALATLDIGPVWPTAFTCVSGVT